MGKYDLPSKGFQDVDEIKYETLVSLTAIANELAEANRLKLLELNLLMFGENNISIEDLKDRA